jgi:cell division septation protein DedD
MAEFDELDVNTPLSDLPMSETVTPRHRRPLFMVVVVMAIAAGGAAIWGGLSSPEKGDDSSGNIPIVRADPEVFRVRPQDPGGMDVPDRDKLVYDRIEGDAERLQVERLLPPPESPMALPGQIEPEPDLPLPPAPPVVPEPITQSVGAKSPPPPASPTQPVTVIGDGFKVQLASVRTLEAARGEWSRLRNRHVDVLGNLDFDVERADLGERGIFFRVRAGPILSEKSAKALCKIMKSRNVSCLVVRP